MENPRMGHFCINNNSNPGGPRGFFYYPELADCLGNIPSKQFKTDELAISYYKEKYGKRLLAVVRDNDPDIKVIYP